MNSLTKILSLATLISSSFIPQSFAKEPKTSIKQETFESIAKLVSERKLEEELVGFSEETASQIPILYNLRKDSKLHSESDIMTVGYIDHWCYFIQKGANLNQLAKIPQSRFNPLEPTMSTMYDRFNSGIYPEHLIKKFTGKQEEYLISIARNSPDFSNGLDWVKNKIKKNLIRNKHAYPPYGKEYFDKKEVDSLDNDLQNIDDLVVPEQAFLIYEHLKFLQKRSTIIALQNEISIAPDEEHGGIIDFVNKRYELYPISQKKVWGKKRGDEYETYSIPDFWRVASYTLGYHTHNQKAELGYRNHSSPIDEGKILNMMTYINNYLLHAVITDHETYTNTDIYYKRLTIKKNKEIVPEENVTVIDIGSFSKQH